MRCIILILVALISLSCSSPALAARHHTAPLTIAEQRAEEFWGKQPSCGYPSLSFVPPPVGSERSGEATFASCDISIFNRAWSTPSEQILEWPSVCLIITHEWGHLVLGPNYYSASNPTEPAHSTNPYNIMDSFDLYPYPESCFPAIFTLTDGTIVRWTATRISISCYTRTRRGHWREWGSKSGVYVERANEAYLN